MESFNKLLNIIDIIAFALGFIFSIIFIFSIKKANKAILYLGLFLMTYIADSLLGLVMEIPAFNSHPNLHLLPVNFMFMNPPLIFLYVKEISFYDTKKTSYWILLPGVLEFTLFLMLFLIGYDGFGKDSMKHTIYVALGIIYMIVFFIVIIIWIRRHLKNFGNKYSTLVKGQIIWVSNFIKANLLLGIMLTVLPFIYFPFWVEIILWLFYLSLLFWLIYRGFYHQGIFKFSQIKQQLKPVNSLWVDQEELVSIFNNIEDYLTESLLFKNSELSLRDLATSLNLPQKKVSRAINIIGKCNFNALINSFRIEQAKLYLKDSSFNNFSAEGIGLEVGFKSRSAFYKAFKKNTGESPIEYRKAVNNH